MIIKTKDNTSYSPLFSIVVPLHNKGSFFHRSLLSICKQTYRDYELIVVDDASTDGGIEHLKSFPELSDKTCVIKRNNAGDGGYAARNLGISLARGKFIALLDADDIWKKNHLEVAKKLISKEVEISFACTGFEEIYQGEKREIGFNDDKLLETSEFLEKYSKTDFMHTNSMIIPIKSFNQTKGFPESGVKRGGDHLLWFQLAMLGKPIAFSSRITTQYCRDNSRIIKTPSAMGGIHPVTQEVQLILKKKKSLNLNLSKADKLNLQRIANRKQFHWLLHRRRLGYSIVSNIRLITLQALTIRGWINIALLFTPSAILKILLFSRDRLRKLINSIP